MYEKTWSSDRMSVEKSHFFDRIGAVLTTLWTLFEPCGCAQRARKRSARNFRHPTARGILRPAQIGREEISMTRLEASRSEQVRFVAAFLIVLAPKVLAQQQTRTFFCSLRARKRTGWKSCGPTRQFAPHRLRDSRHAMCSPVRRNSIGGESGRVDGSRGSEVDASTGVGELQPAPAVAPDQRFWEGQAGNA